MYASLPKKGQTPYGGGEVGNLRTVRMLQVAGYEVTTIRHKKSGSSWGRLHTLLSYPLRLFAGWTETFCKLLFSSRKSIVHLSGFAGVTIFNEYVLMHIFKGLGFRVIYELRGGGVIGFWENGSNSYKKMFHYLIEQACYVFSQGQENISLLQSITKTPIYHYANCVEEEFAPKKMPVKPADRINLLFYGRVEENKHVDLIVEAVSIIQKSLPNVYLSIVGNGKQDYIEHIKEMMNLLLIPNTYCYTPGCKHEALPALLEDKHFYIFPSTQPREGQSNSVTECMAYGIIPIASPQGFNRSTIGDDRLIVDKLDAEEYANRIIEIVKNEQVKELAHHVYTRFCENYTDSVVFNRTLTVYNEIFLKIVKL